MQNRGAGFNLSKGHPNSVGPNKRPFHTIIPGFVLKDNEPFLSFGVMGGDMQAQGHLQILSRILDFSNNVQAAIDAPRWKINSEGTIQIEENLPKTTIDGLRKLGHRIEVLPYGHFDFGAAQLIQKIKNGYIAGSEPRRDGCAVGY